MSAADQNPLYFCPLSDKFITAGEADLLIISKEAKKDLPKPGETLAQTNIILRRAYEEEIEEVEDICRYFWNEIEFFCFNQTFNVRESVNILALAEGEVAGLLSWKKDGNDLYIINLGVYPDFQGQGIGRMLIKEAIEQGRKQGCKTVKIAASNDDIGALFFYQKLGFRFSGIALGALLDHHGGEISGFSGIKVRDEIHLEREL